MSDEVMGLAALLLVIAAAWGIGDLLARAVKHLRGFV